MIKAIIRFSAHNKYLVIAATVVALVGAWWTMRNIPLDALPDQSDTQVIVYSQWDRSPDIIEDQVTYPITTALLGAPKVKAIRGFSDFGFSYVYVIFEDGTDLYWARTRVLEYLSKIQPQLPAGVKTELGPDATGVGWIFQYALVDRSGQHSSDELRSYQDWFLRYSVQSVPGVSEVATVGGQVRQYQVTVNPNALAAYKLPLDAVVQAVRAGNNDVGGRLVELAGREYMVRGRGYVKTIADLENIVLKAEGGTPVLVKDVATVALGPEMRRGVADLDGEGDVVGGIVVMRHGENALNVIHRVKAKLEEVKPSLPKGVEVVTTYDRSELIDHAIETVTHKVIEEVIIVSIIILIFLWHIPSAIIPIVTIPVSVALSFIPMYLMGLNANLMSLSGIAISIGVLVDGAIVEVENAYNKIHHWIQDGKKGDFHEVRLEALLEVGPGVFFSLLVIAVAFMPVFTLVDQEGRLFRPLAYSKNLAMAIAALLAITLDPAMRMLFARIEPYTFRPRFASAIATRVLVGRYYSEEGHPISRVLHHLYERPCRFVVRHAKATIAVSALLVLTTIPVFRHLGSEYMPPLREGTILYMPSAVEPGMSVAEAQKALQVQDKILKTFPEVERVFGKAGRANTSTDPAPFTMMETTIILKPEREWREHPRWYSSWAPEWLKAGLRPFWRDRISYEELEHEMDQALQLPGISNAWTMPIKGRNDMLSTGIRTPIGIKVAGADLAEIEKIGLDVEAALTKVPGTRSVYAERVAGGYFLDFVLKRDQLARYGLSVDAANMMVMTAVGGDNQSTTVMGRERYGINVRYARDYREDLQSLRRVLLPLPGGQGQIPMEEIADVELAQGPSMIRDENGLLAGYVFVDFDTSKVDVGSYVEQAKKAVAAGVKTPTGYSMTWSGQYENMMRVNERLKLILPITLVLIFFLLYMNTRSTFKASVIMLAVPFSAIGAIWLLWMLDYNMSIAVWVGLIALMGLDAETGVFMLLFLDLSHDEYKKKGLLRTESDLVEAIIHGAVKRVRPKAMTVLAAMLGLLPIMWSTGTGADLMKRIAAPMVGGLVTSFLLELTVYPAIYFLWKRKEVVKDGQATPAIAA
ncbi:heavy metal efflux pump, CzcA family [Anaeromyxobacter dehalogenans 2CP-1]|uniref:Heavy metal efflux pump, CzcA family n=1 Tax=Anaeromyxobacter dehalogenans (strain ATCC BAA-258 / DSM 21875 / 2CP-1) TaxID=455488 RepID=B8JAS3_ANAD2|nr:CusA/CzcA family heavy metal efflux RND transporter [Anaeromyxobacter dehalogenans]ACL67572.1 heavy metal efflux pump, CzcA family [Anaeromyxobacter dehalogenans 2CP-1]